MIAIAEDREVEPVVVITKNDLSDGEGLAAPYRKAGVPVYLVCCPTGEGIGPLRERLRGRTSAFCGNTGVGKSSLLNALAPQLELSTGEISKKLGRGRHTTRHVELYSLGRKAISPIPPAFPLDALEGEMVSKDNLPFAFREFAPYLGQCRFSSCSHTGEKGCAIARAVEKGEIHPLRYEN